MFLFLVLVHVWQMSPLLTCHSSNKPLLGCPHVLAVDVGFWLWKKGHDGTPLFLCLTLYSLPPFTWVFLALLPSRLPLALGTQSLWCLTPRQMDVVIHSFIQLIFPRVPLYQPIFQAGEQTNKDPCLPELFSSVGERWHCSDNN